MMLKTNKKQEDHLIKYAEFLIKNGFSTTSGWRLRKKGFVNPINIEGHWYIKQSEIKNFLNRASAGEFAKTSHLAKA